MYFIPYGIIIQQFDPAFVASLGDKVNLTGLSWSTFFTNNLLPVTIGNIIGGSIMVGIVYWTAYLQDVKKPQATPPISNQVADLQDNASKPIVNR